MSMHRLAAAAAVALLWAPVPTTAQTNYVSHDPRVPHQPHLFAAADFGIRPTEVTFNKDIAPILERSCIGCHRSGGAGPMALTSYAEARRYAQRIKDRTAIRDRMGAMPPWYVEKDVGIQHYIGDPSLSDEDLAKIQAWVDNGAPEGRPEDLTVQLQKETVDGWRIHPDLVVESSEVFMEGGAPDWWGEIEPIDIPLEEDRYVKAIEIREVNDVPAEGTGRHTVGGKWVFHHLIYRTEVPGGSREDRTGWPVHEVGRNPDYFPEESGRLLKAGSQIMSESAHLHSTGIDTHARLQFGFELYPEGYEPKYPNARISTSDGLNISIVPEERGQELDAYTVLENNIKIIAFEPHLHAPGDRMCLEAIWKQDIETLTCVGYDHNWVRTYSYAENYEPLLPKGTILHIRGYMNNTDSNPNIPDPRNWQGSGNRSVSNMFMDLGFQVRMTDEEFVAEMAHRREVMGVDVNDHIIGCPLCMAMIPPLPPKEEAEESPSESEAVANPADREP
ncbi:MAG: cytochrome c [Gemmatimonadota bacterium]